MVSFTLLLAAVLLSIATAQDCLDQNKNCPAWKTMGFCDPGSQHFTYMLINCLKTCNLCATPRPSCSDKNAWCSSYKDFCQHPDYIDYVKVECKQTCNFCHITTTPPPTTQPTQPYTGSAGRGLQSNCGHKGPGHTRIVGGTKAKPGDWPWQVNIDYKYNTANPGAHCGGTLINDEWVLSAAHCFESDPVKERYWLKLGEHDIHSTNTYEQRYEIAELILHPSYDIVKNHDYDFALLRLNRSATFNDRVRPACIPGPNTSFPIGTECYISGWGLLNEIHTQGPAILQQAKVPLVDKASCKKAFNHLAHPLTSRMICAGYGDKPIDSCQGDSGGPLVCKKKDDYGQDVWYLWGVVSWGTGCARKGSYGVYARSSYVTEWITEKAFS